jgi:hypothetical protein
MIKHINGMNRITVQANNSPPYISPGAQGSGILRYNTNSNEIEVYDGATWRQLSTNVTIGLDSETQMILDWSREKMLEDQRINELCEKYPGLAKARENFEMFKKLALSDPKEDIIG